MPAFRFREAGAGSSNLLTPTNLNNHLAAIVGTADSALMGVLWDFVRVTASAASTSREISGKPGAIQSKIPGPTGLLRQLAAHAPLYPDHKWPEDSSTASVMFLVHQPGQAPLPQ